VQARWAGDPLAAESGSVRHAVFGLPLGGGPGGVAYVTSLTATDFPVDDQRLLLDAVERASAAVAPRRDEALHIRERALSTFAHDVRSPLGVVLMQAGVLLRSAGRPEPPDRLVRRATSVQRASLRIERLLADYVAFHELRAGRLVLTVAPLDPAALLRQTAEELRSLAGERHVALEVEAPPALPPLAGDAARLREALEQLVRAALLVVPDGGRVILRVQEDKGDVVFSVQDSAPPIAAEDLDRAFDRAWQGERPAIGRGGLGLAVARGLVELHGGRIWATSASGSGNIFSFALTRTS
jgi:signal transduction histidine kinase